MNKICNKIKDFVAKQDRFASLFNSNDCSIYYAGVAQLVEQLIRNQQVVGSSPIFSSKVSAARFAIAYLAAIFYIFSYLMVKNVIFLPLKVYTYL